MGTNAAIPTDAATDRGVYDALQRRVFALTHRRRVVGATSGRVIFVQRNLFGGYTPIDFRWQDLRESEVKVGALGATLILSAYKSEDLATQEGPPERLIIDGLRKKEAQDVYRVCQTRAQAWREKRRIRELEEMRARAGGIQLGALGGAAAAAPAAGGNGGDNSPMARLQRAKGMRDEGLLTDAEFEQVKAKILTEL